MPIRQVKFVNGGYYHVFNKMIDNHRVFSKDEYCTRFLQVVEYYRSSKAKMRFSHLKNLAPVFLDKIQRDVSFRKFFKVDIIAFCLMPNHFHFLLKQLQDNGVTKFLADITNAFTRFFNTKNERKGPIFLPRFQGVRIRGGEQFIHTGRYIHVNSYSSSVVKDLDELVSYSWSSLPQYIKGGKNGLCQTEDMMFHFGDSKKSYKDFVFNHADYQKSLELVKHARNWR